MAHRNSAHSKHFSTAPAPGRYHAVVWLDSRQARVTYVSRDDSEAGDGAARRSTVSITYRGGKNLIEARGRCARGLSRSRRGVRQSQGRAADGPLNGEGRLPEVSASAFSRDLRACFKSRG